MNPIANAEAPDRHVDMSGLPQRVGLDRTKDNGSPQFIPSGPSKVPCSARISKNSELSAAANTTPRLARVLMSGLGGGVGIDAVMENPDSGKGRRSVTRSGERTPHRRRADCRDNPKAPSRAQET